MSMWYGAIKTGVVRGAVWWAIFNRVSNEPLSVIGLKMRRQLIEYGDSEKIDRVLSSECTIYVEDSLMEHKGLRADLNQDWSKLAGDVFDPGYSEYKEDLDTQMRKMKELQDFLSDVKLAREFLATKHKEEEDETDNGTDGDSDQSEREELPDDEAGISGDD
jgi:hypothetical protein